MALVVPCAVREQVAQRGLCFLEVESLETGLNQPLGAHLGRGLVESERRLLPGPEFVASQARRPGSVQRGEEPGARVVRRTRRVGAAELARHAHRYLQFKPDTDVALLNAMMHTIVSERLVDPAFIAERTVGYAELEANVAGYSPEAMAPICGIDADTLRDFAAVSRGMETPSILVVNPSVAAKSMKELAELARQNPGKFNIGGPFQMGAHRVAWEAFAEAAKIKGNWIAYRGGGPTLLAVAGGHVDGAATNPGNVKPYIISGKVRVLASTGTQRTAAMPELPTVMEAGVPGFSSGTWYALFAPAKTPREIVNRLNADLARIVAAPDVRERFIGEGVEPIGGSTDLFAVCSEPGARTQTRPIEIACALVEQTERRL